MPGIVELAPRALVDSLLRSQLTPFIERVFYTLNPGRTYHCGYHIRALAHHLELVERGEIRRLAIAMPPRHLKSICASVAFPAWVLGRDPSRRIIAPTAPRLAPGSPRFAYHSSATSISRAT